MKSSTTAAIKFFLLPSLFIMVTLLVSPNKITAQTLPISFNFQSTTMPAGLTSNGTISTSGSVGTCAVCSPGRINIPVTTGYFQIDVPAVSAANLNMKSSGASARIVTVKYKHGSAPDYTTAGTVSVPQSGNAFELLTLFPAIASTSTTSIRLENGTGGEFHIHDIFVNGSPAQSAEAEISAFTIAGQIGTETINSALGKVELQVAAGTPLSSVVPTTVTLSTGATINPTATTARDFSGAVEVPYVVTAQNGTTTKNWTVKVTEVLSAEKEILGFVLSPDQIGNAVINSGAGTISVVMPNTTSLTSITPMTLTISPNATISPLATAAQNFGSPVQYTVTAQNGSTKIWTVSVTQVPPPTSFHEYEAEQAEFTGTVDNNNAGFTGTGFINFLANGENYILFNVCQTSAGAQTAKFRYALGVVENRIGKLYVNDVLIQNLTFPPTGAWTTWAEEIVVVSLQQGMNSIKVTWEDTDGPNVDKLLLTGTQCPQYTLTLTTTNSGTVSLSPARFANKYFNVETVTLLAQIRPDLVFNNWSGDLTGNTNPASIAMTSNKLVTANFTQIPTYTLQVNTSGIGEVLLSPAGGVYASGTTVTLTANPVLGSSFLGWGGDASGTASVTTIQMSANKTVTASFTNSATINFESPIGFASVNTGSTYPDFNGPVTGGQNATDTFWVNGQGDFDALAWHLYYRNRAYKNLSGTNGVPKAPLVIVFKPGIYNEGTSSSSAWGNHMMTVQEQGDLTIIGQGIVTLKFGLNLKRSWNILVRNIHFQDYYDDGINIGESETHHVWIDHCTLGHPTTMPVDSEHPDGGVDTKSGASYVTISWCVFRNNWKTSLIGHSDGNGSEDIGKLKVTYFANHFLNTNSRNPRVRFGEVHVLNNLIEKVGLYGTVSAKDARVVAEGNFFLNTKWPMYADRTLADFRTVYGINTDNVFTSKTGNLPCIYLKQFNNDYDDSGLPVITAQINPAMLNPGGRSIKFDELNAAAAFDPHSYYTYTAFPPSVARAVVPLFAGAGRIDFFTQTSTTTSTITANSTLTPFSQTIGSPSAVQTYTVSADNLTGNLTITPPTNYEVSSNGGSTWFTNASPLSIIPVGGSIPITIISVRLNATVGGSYSGNIVHTSTGATNVDVAVSGTAAVSAGNWIIYQANQLPGAFTPAFVVSQQSGSFSNAIIPDPNQAGNNLLYMQTTANADNNQWRQNLTAGSTQITLVIRAKGIVDANLAFDADLDFGGNRWQTRILNNGNYSIVNGTPTTTGSLGIDPLQWNIYRFTRNGTQTAIYVNENPVAIYTGTAAVAGSNNYFRFGDGWGSGKINSHIDWVAWDVTGAYSPVDVSLPPSLGGANNPAFTVTASLGNFTQMVGSPSSTQTYTVSGSNLTTALTITPPVNYEVSADNGTTWFNNVTPLVLSPVSGTINSTTISVRLNAGSPGNFSGNITHSSSSLSVQNVAVNGITSAAPVPVITVTASLSQFNQTIGAPSATQTYTVSAINLTNNVTLTPPAGYEISNDGGTTWFNNSNPLQLTGTAGTLAPTTITVRLNAITAGPYNGDITHASTGASTEILTLNGNAVNPPAITTSGTLNAFSQTVGTPSATQTYTVSAANLTGTVTITPPAGFEVSANGGTTWFSNSSPLVLTGTAGTLANTTITVRLNSSVAGNYSGNITHVSPGAVTKNVAVSGVSVNPPTITSTGTLNAFTQTIGNPSANQTYTVAGANLTGNVTVAPPAGYEISANGGTNWFTNATPLVLTGTSGTLANTTITIRLNATTAGNYNGNVTHVSAGAVTLNVAVTGTAVNPPAINTVSTLLQFDHTLWAPSAAQTFTVSGSNLTGSVTITPPANYEVSLNNITWVGSNSPLVLTGSSGTLANTTIRVRLNALATGQHNGDITVQTSGTAPKTIAVTGFTHPSMSIGPNPARETINLYHSFLFSTGEINIYDAYGRLVRSMRTTPASNKTTIDINALPAGVYTIEYARGEERESFRFIKL